MVVFAHHNVIKDPPFSKMDLITCRNLLIYMNSDLQKRIIPLFHYSLNDDGILLLGSSESIGDNINSTGNDAPIALSPDGQKLFIFKSTLKDKGDIYMSKLDGNTWSVPVSLNSNINTNMWEGSVTLSSDERTLYFASERKGGFGGRDLYRSLLQSDGTWGKAENLGPTINTPYN